jgi:hypothetical protein
VDQTIAALIGRDTPSLASLAKWTRRGPAILRVNAAGILAKVGSPTMDNDVVSTLKADREARELYLTAVVSRVLGIPWDDACRLVISGQPLGEYIEPLAIEACNPKDSGARWCSVVLLGRARSADTQQVNDALGAALKTETSRENLRAIACALAGLDPIAT